MPFLRARPVPSTDTPRRVTVGFASQRSLTVTLSVTSTILLFGGQRVAGFAATAIVGATVSRTTTVIVSGVESAWPSLTTSVTVETPSGKLNNCSAPSAVPNGPLQ